MPRVPKKILGFNAEKHRVSLIKKGAKEVESTNQTGIDTFIELMRALGRDTNVKLSMDQISDYHFELAHFGFENVNPALVDALALISAGEISEMPSVPQIIRLIQAA